MKADELLDIIGETKGVYVMEAQRHREERPQKSPHSRWKVLLIAAIVSILLAGCAVAYVLRLENMKLGEFTVPSHDTQNTESTLTGNVLSLQGIKGSNAYNAGKEWLDYLNAYQREADTSAPLTSEEEMKYYGLMCSTRAMADKVDELCEKYGLHLHGEVFHEVPYADMCRLMGFDSIIREGIDVEDSNWGGRFYQDGNFYIESTLTLPGSEEPASYIFNYSYNPKNAFDDVFVYIGDMEKFREWSYTTENGTELLLILGQRGAILASDREDAFISVNIDPTWEPFEMSKGEVEALAEIFDLSIQTTPLDVSALEEARAIQQTVIEARLGEDPFVKDSYGEFAKSLLSLVEAAEEYTYTIRDMNRDGTEELVIFRDEMACNFVTMSKGKTAEFGNGRPKIWREEDVFIEIYDYPSEYPGEEDKGAAIYRYDGTAKVALKNYLHYQDGWREWTPGTDEISETVLTEEKFEAIVDSYHPIDLSTLNLKPLRELAERK